MIAEASDLHLRNKEWKSPLSSMGNVRKGSNALAEGPLCGRGRPFRLVREPNVRGSEEVELCEVESGEVESFSLSLCFEERDTADGRFDGDECVLLDLLRRA
jgi:hypothetical protein